MPVTSPPTPFGPPLSRRHWLQASGAMLGGALAGCDRAPRTLAGGFTGIDMARGHALRDLLA
ncbi:hypothetical protein, partial [Acidovorax sp. T1m]|uniref:hypothetical protein n=1 Tax=Acidovorax sp. T1m TaxID=2006116 RepID=UPI001177E198